MFEQYLSIINAIDVERVTEVELIALEDEMAYSDDISNREYETLIARLTEVVR